MVKLRTLLTVFIFNLKAEARDYGKGRGGSGGGGGQGGQCPPVSKLGPPFGPPKFGIILQQTILGEMRSLSCKLYVYKKKNITSC